MKTTDLLYQNQKVLNALQEMLLQTKKHVEFWRLVRPKCAQTLKASPKACKRVLIFWKIKSCLTVIHATSSQKKLPAKIKRMTLSQLKSWSGVSKPFANVTPQTCISV